LDGPGAVFGKTERSRVNGSGRTFEGSQGDPENKGSGGDSIGLVRVNGRASVRARAPVPRGSRGLGGKSCLRAPFGDCMKPLCG